MNTTTDSNAEGVFAVKHPNGSVLFDTFKATAAAARSAFERAHRKTWHVAEAEGYALFGYAESVKVVLPRSEYEDDAGDAGFDIPRTADEWELYKSQPGAEEAAQALGTRLKQLVTAARHSGDCSYSEGARIRDLMYLEMDKYENLGARDTEPELVLVARISAALNLNERLSR